MANQPTSEQVDLERALIAEYGEQVYSQAREFSGIALCLSALALEDLDAAERARLFRQASLHLAQLLNTVMQPAHSAKVVECAKRIDSAIGIWMCDDIEAREGLPRRPA